MARTTARAAGAASADSRKTAVRKTEAARKTPVPRKAATTGASSPRKGSARKVAKAPTRKQTPAKRATAKRAPASPKRAPASPKRAPASPMRVANAAPATKSTRNALALYSQKRDFTRTKEPSGAVVSEAPAGKLQFVVQKHAASHLHYDFRLELNGVLLSWSVPKGPSLRSGERRLAVRTEDHPLDYATFEGTIPKGEYGGGSVLVWDRGSWQPDGDADKDFARGRLTFTLAGQKLSGRFHLVRSRPDASKRENWLLFKGRDDAARDLDIVDERPESVLSGKTIDQIGETQPGKTHAAKTQPGKTHADKTHAGKTQPGKVAVKATGKRAKTKSAEPVSEHVADMVEMVARLSPGFALTSLDKVLYPEQGLRKAEIIAYYVSVASVMLPYVGKRPLVLVRCPRGRTEACFYQKHIDKGVPAAVKRVNIKESSKRVQYASVEDANGLIALAQMGVLEIHNWGCHADQVEKPDLFVFDIDPDEGLSFELVVETALALRQALADQGLTSFVKTTGGKGLHVVAPVERGLSWEQHKAFSYSVVDQLARARPDRYLTTMRKDLRKGKLFLDYLRNGRGATAIAPYSTRARAGALVATPLRWEELTRALTPADFDVRSVLRRLEQQKVEPWEGFHELKQVVSPGQIKKL